MKIDAKRSTATSASSKISPVPLNELSKAKIEISKIFSIYPTISSDLSELGWEMQMTSSVYFFDYVAVRKLK